MKQIVIDTNIVVSALRSRKGASHLLLNLIDSGKFQINISVPLILEYEYSSKKLIGEIKLTKEDIDDILNYICSIANKIKVFYLWRPYLRDPKDDMVLELAVSANCDYIVTYNIKDFIGIDKFGIKTITPKEFLQEIGEIK
jgi:putative PIN family toxin of toxin-antitoxin system